MHVGLVVNPIAGMGGRVGLKGTDGKVDEARARGASPRAPERSRRMLQRLADHDPTLSLSAAGDPMGASLAREAGFDPQIVSEPASETTVDDTRAAIAGFIERGVDLVVFVGGDGTAADVADALASTGIPMLGVPAGVKVYSAVFAVSPEDAADIIVSFERTERREVMDINEDDYRDGEVYPELRAVAWVPVTDELHSRRNSSAAAPSTHWLRESPMASTPRRPTCSVLAQQSGQSSRHWDLRARRLGSTSGAMANSSFGTAAKLRFWLHSAIETSLSSHPSAARGSCSAVGTHSFRRQ